MRVEELEWFCSGCRGGRGEERRRVLGGMETEKLVDLVLQLERRRGFGVGGEGEGRVLRALEKGGETIRGIGESVGREMPFLDVGKVVASLCARGVVRMEGEKVVLVSEAQDSKLSGWILPVCDAHLVDDDTVAFSHRFCPLTNGTS